MRRFLFAFANKKFLIFLFFLVLSSTFWLAIALNETVEKEISIPIRLINVPKNAIITTPLPDSIRVVLREKGFGLLTYMYGNKLKPISVSFDTYANKNNNVATIPVSDVQKTVLSYLYASTKIVSIKPDKLEFYYNFGLSKLVPIRLLGKVAPSKGYYLAQTLFVPEHVTIYASKHLLDSISNIYTEPLNITSFSDTIKTSVRLQKIRGVKIVPQVVSLFLYPDILTEESIEVPITAVNMPSNRVLRTFPSRVKVFYSVGASRYRTINENAFRVEADYKTIENKASSKCRIAIKSFPQGVSNVRLEVNEIDYLIEQN